MRIGANCPNAIRMAVALKPGTICVTETINPRGKYAATRHGSAVYNAELDEDASDESRMDTTPISTGIATPAQNKIARTGVILAPLISAVSTGVAPTISPTKRQITWKIYGSKNF